MRRALQGARLPLQLDRRPERRGDRVFNGFNLLFLWGWLLVRDLGLVNTRWAMLLPSALGVWHARTWSRWRRASTWRRF